jgi:hypothetical protein
MDVIYICAKKEPTNKKDICPVENVNKDCK